MKHFNEELMYEFHVKDLTQAEALKPYADHAVREIKSAVGWDADVQIHIGPEAKDKRIYSVSIGVFGLGDPIVVRREGKHVIAVLRKVRKSVLRRVHKKNAKEVSLRRKRIFKAQFAS